MPQYLIAYLGGNRPASPEEGKQHFAKYMEWLNALGDAAISPANPLNDTRTINPDGTIVSGGTSEMSGFTIIDADSMEAAEEIAKHCPFLEVGGSFDVSELIKMSKPD